VRLAAPGTAVTGLDLAPALIDTANRLASERGLTINYQVRDAENLPFPDGSFDVVVSSIGSMFAPDHAAVAHELARVCRPGGRLGLAHWSPDTGVIDMFRVMARFAPPPPPGAGSPFQWGDRGHVADLLGEASELRYEEGDAPPPKRSWELFSTVYGPTRVLAESLDPERREEFHQAFVALYEKYPGRGAPASPVPAGSRHPARRAIMSACRRTRTAAATAPRPLSYAGR
jgi:Methylase involved in ubiquinone/menaquinone biosynthesis